MGTSALEKYADLPGFHDAFRRALAGQPTKLATRVAQLEFEVDIGPSLDEEGRVDGVIGVAFDVTERKRTEAGLQTTLTELRDVDRRKNDFIAVLSHELRNPLAAIENGVFVVAQSPAGSEQARRALAIVDRQTAQLTRLLDDLLDVSQITQNDDYGCSTPPPAGGGSCHGYGTAGAGAAAIAMFPAASCVSSGHPSVDS